MNIINGPTQIGETFFTQNDYCVASSRLTFYGIRCPLILQQITNNLNAEYKEKCAGIFMSSLLRSWLEGPLKSVKMILRLHHLVGQIKVYSWMSEKFNYTLFIFKNKLQFTIVV